MNGRVQAGAASEAAASGSATSAAPVHLALIAVQLMFASLSVEAKVALRQLTPFALVTVRAGGAFVVFLLVCLAWRPRERVALRHLPELALYALLGVTLNQLLFIQGLERTTATNAVVMGSTIPVFTAGVAIVLGRERATPFKLAGLGVALTGALVIVGGGGFEAGGRRLIGNLLVVCNSLSFATYLVISRRLLARYRPLTVVTWVFLFGSLGVLPFGGGALVSQAAAVTGRGWLSVAYIILFPTVGSYFLNTFALGRAPASLVATYIYLQPVVGALLAAVRLGERPAPSTYLGATGIAAGIWLVARDARRARTRAA